MSCILSLGFETRPATHGLTPLAHQNLVKQCTDVGIPFLESMPSPCVK